MKNGFTLVELSIVLVIIGLLIGGILVGQSLIDSAKSQSFVRQMGQYDSAVDLFKDKYRELPGDSRLLSEPGNGDGEIDGVDVFENEIANFWHHLSLAGLNSPDGGNYLTDGTSGISFDHTPQAAIGDKTYILGDGHNAGSVVNSVFGITGIHHSYYLIDCSAMVNEGFDCSNSLTGTEALSIDAKMDDGDGTAGEVIGLSVSNANETDNIMEATPIAHSAGDIINRTLVIRMGATNGNLK